MSIGNSKCKRMYIFNLPSVISCPRHKDCEAVCYAKKAEWLYPEAKERRARNFLLAKKNLSDLETLIRAQLSKGRLKVCRIHESGDFFNQKYLDMWVRVMRDFPKIRFFAFTKTRGLRDFAEADSLPNVNIIDSYIFGKFLNFGPDWYVDDLLKRYKRIFLCPSSAEKDTPKCNIDCTYCIDGGKYSINYIH